MLAFRFLDGAEDAQYLGAIESLPFAMVTEAHSHLAFTSAACRRNMRYRHAITGPKGDITRACSHPTSEMDEAVWPQRPFRLFTYKIVVR